MEPFLFSEHSVFLLLSEDMLIFVLKTVLIGCSLQSNLLFQLFPIAKDLLASADRYHRSEIPESNILVIGVPNVGKSSLINVLRNRTLHLRGE